MDSFHLSRAIRSLRLGGLTGRVGASYLGQRLKSLFQSPEDMAESLSKTHRRNAERIAETLGQLKGAVMKLGQMASLQADLFPPEITEVLAGLQNAAPPMPYDVISAHVRTELGEKPEWVFREFEREAFASASIGQVHRGKLHDGRSVAVKVQYPNIEKMLEDDIRNLGLIFRLVQQVGPGIDLTIIFEELKSHLLEEIDYEQEAGNLKEFRESLADIPWLIIPAPIPEFSTRRILTMELVEGEAARSLEQRHISQDRRNRFCERLADLFTHQVLDLHLMHADPNIANFALTDDERIIMYDFGCVKRFPGWFIHEFKAFLRDGLSGRIDSLGEDFRRLGMYKRNGELVDTQVITAYRDVLIRPFLPGVRYDFGRTDLHKYLLQLGFDQMRESHDYIFPRHVVFINRVLGGMYGNFIRLAACADWGAILRRRLGMMEGNMNAGSHRPPEPNQDTVPD
ncbi:AarF/ABC1/UbiB kinase family protein [bacterium]|nr:AarF/ABC1/UbiB kinase family protein [candidate division CSSED10-310 bacterium]